MNQVNFLQSLGWSLINSLWQMALLWVVYQFIAVSFHKIRPAHKTSLATILTFSGFAKNAASPIGNWPFSPAQVKMISACFAKSLQSCQFTNWWTPVPPNLNPTPPTTTQPTKRRIRPRLPPVRKLAPLPAAPPATLHAAVFAASFATCPVVGVLAFRISLIQGERVSSPS